MKQSHKTILLWLLLILTFVSVYNLVSHPAREEGKLDFSTFIAEVEKSPAEIKRVTIKGSRYTVEREDGNAVYAIGDTFLEVVSPTRPDTTASRYLDRRGDGGSECRSWWSVSGSVSARNGGRPVSR